MLKIQIKIQHRDTESTELHRGTEEQRNRETEEQRNRETGEMSEFEHNTISGQIINAAIEVHRELGAGLLESVYEYCLLDELKRRGLRAERQILIPVCYKGNQLDKEFVIDILVEDKIVVELKSVEAILPIHEFQLLTYLKLSVKKLGLLINFNVPQLKDGIRRKIIGTL